MAIVLEKIGSINNLYGFSTTINQLSHEWVSRQPSPCSGPLSPSEHRLPVLLVLVVVVPACNVVEGGRAVLVVLVAVVGSLLVLVE